MFAFAPKSSLVDEITEIRITHLKPLQSITLEAKLVGDKGELFESYAHYVADKGGNVDVGHDLSIGGSYSGVEPMGLIWSMKQAPGQRKGIRLMKSDVTVPYDIIVNCFDGHVIPRETSLPPFSSGTFRKSYMADGVRRVSVRKGRIRGTLFLPPGDGPFPGNCEMTFSIQLVTNCTSRFQNRPWPPPPAQISGHLTFLKIVLQVVIFFLKWATHHGKRTFKTRTIGIARFNLLSKDLNYKVEGKRYCWFSHDVTKMQTKKLSILPRFYFHDALEQLKTNFPTNFRFKRILGFVIEYA